MHRQPASRVRRRRGDLAARTGAALAFLLWSGLARAQSVTVTVPTFTGYVENAMTLDVNSSIALDVRHNASAARYQVDVRMPSTSYTALGGTGPGTAWTATTYTSGGYGYVRFTATCPGTGLAPNTTARFIVNLRPTSAVAVDTRSSLFQVTASQYVSGNRCRTGQSVSGNTPTPQPWVKVLAVADAAGGAALQQLAPPAIVRWTVSNYSSAQKTGVTVTNRPTGTACAPATGTGTTLTLPAYAGTTPGRGTLRCTYPATAGQSFDLVGTNVTGTTSPATAVGVAIAPIDVGNASVAWTRATLIRGRVRDPLVLVVNNASRATVTRVDVVAPSSGWAVSSAGATTTGGGGLSYVPGSDSGVAFTGTIAAGGTATLTIRYASLPGTGAGTYGFQVKLTPSSGSDYAWTSPTQTVTVQSIATFPPDVSLLTVRSGAAGQALEWTNPASAHAGVAVFKATPPALPSPPLDFVDYTQAGTDPALVYASNAAATAAATDPAVGSFNYLVCNHDASFIYSECDTAGAQRVQYSGNSARPPAGGWTTQVGGEALNQLMMYAAGRAAMPTSRGDLSVVNLADGTRALDKGGRAIAPIPLSYGLPATYSPSWRLANGTLVSISADGSGWVTAIDLESGTQYWRKQKNGEAFSGASGVSPAGASTAFKASYPSMDVLFLGSSTTGNVLAIDAATGTTLWTVRAGSTVHTLTTYDAATNTLWVPTAAGVQAWDLGPSGPSTPARLAWSAALGAHSMYCVRTTVAPLMACADNAGTVRLLDKSSGAVKASVATGVSLPSSLVRIATGTPGLAIGNAQQVVRIVASDGTLAKLDTKAPWGPSGWTLSPFLMFSASGYLVVGASDLTDRGIHLYKLSSETLAQLGRSPDTVQPANPRTLIGPPSYDSTSGLYFFGTEEGRIWAIPSSSF